MHPLPTIDAEYKHTTTGDDQSKGREMSLDAMKQALAVLEEIADEVFSPYDNKLGDAILALRAALEGAKKPRQWQWLTEAEKVNVALECGCADVAWMDFADAIEKKLKEKNLWK